MNVEKLTSQFRAALVEAQSLALGHDHAVIEPEHVALAMLSVSESSIEALLSSCGVDCSTLVQSLKKACEALPKVSDGRGEVTISRTLQRVFNLADQAAQKRGDAYIASDLFLLASLQMPESTLASLLVKHGLEEQAFTKAVAKARKSGPKSSSDEQSGADILKKYTNDLTLLAEQGKLDPVIGRDGEIRRTIQVLARRTKNNPVLIGQPGVGKTAIAEGLAQRIINNEVPEGIRHKRLLSLDIASMLAGAKYRGEFEERMKAVLKEVKAQAGGVILFIDELHILVGAGRSDGAMDASNMLKPALARGELHCIGATTLDEYRNYIEKDQALERRFQKVQVDEPTEQDTVAILRGLKERYELHHCVTITDPAIIAAVQLSQRYIADRQLPDKAIDLIDEAASRIRMEMDSKPEHLDVLDRKLIQLKMEREALKKEDDEASKQRLKDLESQISEVSLQYADLEEVWKNEKASIQGAQAMKEQLDQARVDFETAQRSSDLARMSELQYGIIPELEKRLNNASVHEDSAVELTLLRNKVTEEEVASVVAKWTGIAVESMLASEKEKLVSLPETLSSQVIGQKAPVHRVAEAIQRSRAGLSASGRPIGSFLFLGPTGVGKTELCRALSRVLFDDASAVVRVDMSEYMEKHAVSRLIGAPPGYVGYDQGGYLTEKVRRKPYSVILLDEVEKAHPDVFHVLLQLLDDGRLTDGQGRTVDFQHSIVVMTSNLGSQKIRDLQGEDYDIIKAAVMDEVRGFFKPEFINRIDDVVVFKGLEKTDLGKILDIQLNDLKERLARQNITFTVSTAMRQALLEAGYDPVFGARPLRRAVQSLLENAFAKALLSGNIQPGKHVKVAWCEKTSMPLLSVDTTDTEAR